MTTESPFSWVAARLCATRDERRRTGWFRVRRSLVTAEAAEREGRDGGEYYRELGARPPHDARD